MNNPFAKAAEQLGEAGVIPHVPKERPRLKISPVVSTLAEQLGYEMGKGKRLWMRAGVVCYIVESPENPGVFGFEPMPAKVFRTWVELFVTLYKTEYVKGEDGEMQPRDVPRSLTADAADTILQSPQFQNLLPVVRRVNRVRLPYFREENGEKVLRLLDDGYDEATGIYTFGLGSPIDEKMTLEQAVEWLSQLFSEVKYPLRPVPGVEKQYRHCPRARAVSWAGLFSLYTSGLLGRNHQRMGFLFTANGPGAGKTTLAKVPIATVLGEMRLIKWSSDEAKMTERVDVCLLSGYSALFFDNVKAKIDSDLIEMLMSSPTWTVRKFHTQTNVVMSNETTIFITGNDTEAGSDSNRRFLYVELDMSNSDPRADVRKKDLTDAWLLTPENRARTLSALWSMTKAWDAAGRPGPQDIEGNELPTVSGFKSWCKIVGGIVTMATPITKGEVGDPFESPELKTSGDKDGRDLIKLLTFVLAEGLGGGATFEDLCRIGMVNGLFDKVLPELPEGAEVGDVLDKPSRAKFAQLIGKQSGERKDGNGGKTFTVDLGGGKQLIRFFFEGSGRHKKFKVENV